MYPCSHSSHSTLIFPVPARSYSSTAYRYGYQGSEKDDEIKGEGLSYTTYYRMLDPRVGRWWSIDPVFKPWQSGIVLNGNNPITLIDPNGDDEYYNEAGDYLYTDNQSSDNVMILPQQQWEKIEKKYCNELDNKDVISDELINELKDNSITLNDAIGKGILSLESVSKILTDIVLQLNEVNPSDIINGQVSIVSRTMELDEYDEEVYTDIGYNHIYENDEGTRLRMPFTILAEGAYSFETKTGEFAIVALIENKHLSQLSTKADIQSTLGIHEYFLHQVKGMGNNQHPEIYKLLQQHRTWEKVSPETKRYYEKTKAYHKQ